MQLRATYKDTIIRRLVQRCGQPSGAVARSPPRLLRGTGKNSIAKRVGQHGRQPAGAVALCPPMVFTETGKKVVVQQRLKMFWALRPAFSFDVVGFVPDISL